MANILKMVKQAASMQKEIKSIQKDLARKTVEFTGGGLVTVVARGDMSIDSIKIDPKLVNSSDTGRIEDLVVSAVNGALQVAKKQAESEMSKLAGGLGLGDIFG